MFYVQIEIKAHLFSGSHRNEGRVQLYYNNAWRPVCGRSSDWDLNEANVVCKMFDRPYATRVWGEGQSGVEHRNTSVYRPECIGTEGSIVDCLNSGWGTACNNSDLWVTCAGTGVCRDIAIYTYIRRYVYPIFIAPS